MSTRCQIGFYQDTVLPGGNLTQPDALIYRHCDGYPDTKHGVLAELKPVLKAFRKARGFFDAEHAAAYTLAQWMDGVTGFGVSQCLHGDIEYYYAVTDRMIQVYTVVGDPGCDGFAAFSYHATARW